MNENNISKKIMIIIIAVLICLCVVAGVIYYMKSSTTEKNAKTVEAEKIDEETVTETETKTEAGTESEADTETETDEGSVNESESADIEETELVEAVRNYCYEQNPDLKDVEDDEEYPVYWEVSDENDTQVVVVFRSYTGALNRFYIDKATGDTYVTEYVPMVMEEEEQTGESFNVKDYLTK
ncbi:MAG: hypothetical protein K6D96_03775 [Acetatifactor sp.]|nr:hypothetical protein [Acetatifactor sp.]